MLRLSAVEITEAARRCGMPEFCEWHNQLWHDQRADLTDTVIALLALTILMIKRSMWLAAAIILLEIGGAVAVHPVQTWDTLTSVLLAHSRSSPRRIHVEFTDR